MRQETITTDIAYRVRVTPKRSRGPKNVSVREIATFPIRCLDGAEAPVALAYRSGWVTYDANAEHGRIELSPLTELRSHDGALWEPVTRHHGRERLARTLDEFRLLVAPPDGPRNDLGARLASDNPFHLGGSENLQRDRGSISALPRRTEVEAREWHGDNRDRVFARLNAVAADHIAVDGILHKKASAPCWTVMDSYGVRLQLKTNPVVSVDDFPLGRMADATRWADDMARISRRPRTETAGEVSVFDWSLVPDDFAGDIAWSMLRQLLPATLPAMNQKDTFKAIVPFWMKLKEIEAAGSVPREAIPEVLDLAKRMIAILPYDDYYTLAHVDEARDRAAPLVRTHDRRMSEYEGIPRFRRDLTERLSVLDEQDDDALSGMAP